MAIVIGSNVAHELTPEKEYSEGQGWSNVRVWEGPSKASVEGVIPELTGYTRIQVFSPDGLIWRMRASFGGQGDGEVEDIVDTWELDDQSVLNDVLNHPNSMAINKDAIKRILKNVNNSSEPVTVYTDFPLKQLYNLLFARQTAYYKGNLVLRHTQTISGRTSPALDLSGCQKIWAYNELPQMPTHIADAILSVLPEGYIPDYAWGWLKLNTKIVTSYNAKTQVIEEWVLDNWSTYIYQYYVPA